MSQLHGLIQIFEGVCSEWTISSIKPFQRVMLQIWANCEGGILDTPRKSMKKLRVDVTKSNFEP